jgi:RNA polymerase sigma-70 factor (ECF subfamily)
LKKSFFRAADRTKGKFRSFLLASLKYYLLDQRALQSAKKRGSGIPLVSLDEETPEGRYVQEPATDMPAETLFDREWARTVLAQVHLYLREEHRSKGKLEVYEKLKPFLLDESSMNNYDDVAAKLKMKPATVAVTVHRLRHRYRELVRAEIARTVADPKEITSEMEHFYAVIGAAG